MKRIFSLLMALVLAAGVCVLISSCGEADDTSSSNEASDVPSGHDIISASEIGGDWNDFIVTEKIKPVCIVTDIGAEAPNYAYGHSNLNLRSYGTIKTEILEIEKHIVSEMAENDYLKYDLEAGVYIYDYQLYSDGRFGQTINLAPYNAIDRMIIVKFNKGDMIKITAIDGDFYENGEIARVSYFKLDTDTSVLINAIKEAVH